MLTSTPPWQSMGMQQKKTWQTHHFFVYFELGANNEGYWTYNHMSIQFKDCVDCLRVIYPHFDFTFLFDHSQGHSKKLANGLETYSMNKGYGGAQPRMRESIIKEKDGYLGMHLSTVSVGDTQSPFIFQPGDNGPFWMTEEQRQLNCHDRILSPRPWNPTTWNTCVYRNLKMPAMTRTLHLSKLNNSQPTFIRKGTILESHCWNCLTAFFSMLLHTYVRLLKTNLWSKVTKKRSNSLEKVAMSLYICVFYSL
jgi:hypothetical protein